MGLFGCNEARIIDRTAARIIERLTALINQWGNSFIDAIAGVHHMVANTHQVVTGVHLDLKQQLNRMEEKMTADFSTIYSALTNLTREVGETATVIREQTAEIEGLKGRINDPTVQAEIENIAARLNEQAAVLDALQPTVEEEETSDDAPPTA